MKDRKAFSFYRSYYEIIVELPDDQKLPLLMAILNKQFLDIEPQLTGLPALLYKSQKHSIDKQVSGFKSKMGITTPCQGPYQGPTEGPTQGTMLDPTEGPCQGPTEGPCQQEKEKGQEKEEGQVEGQVYPADAGVEDKLNRKSELHKIIKDGFAGVVPNIIKLIEINDVDRVYTNYRDLWNKYQSEIMEYQSIRI